MNIRTKDWHLRSRSKQEKAFVSILALPVFYFVYLFVTAAKSNISEVPFWDEWDSKFLMNPKGNSITWESFWRQHNEHRIIFSKIFFLIDYTLFNGKTAPLIWLNIFLTFGIIAIFARLVFNLSRGNSKFIPILLTSSIMVLFTSLIGSENLYWGFQSQFYLSILLPFLSFYLYSVFEVKGERKYLVIALIIGFCAIGTMASGLMTLPAILFVQVILRKPLRICLVTVVVTTAAFLLYFHHYRFVFNSPFSTLIHHPLFVVKYDALLLGNIVFTQTNHNVYLTILFDLIIVSYVGRAFLQLLKNKNVSLAHICSSLLLVYCLGFGLETAAGRFTFGYGEALSSRYTLFSITAISAAIVVAFELDREKSGFRNISAILPILLIATLLPLQRSDSANHHDLNFQKNVAALALFLGVNDDSQVSFVYPAPKNIVKKVEILKANNQAIFGSTLFKQVNKVTPPSKLTNAPLCRGNLELAIPLKSIGGYQFKVRGWILDEHKTQLSVAQIYDPNNELLGSALVGGSRPDVANLYGKASLWTGFEGYIKSGNPIQVIGEDAKGRVICKVAISHRVQGL